MNHFFTQLPVIITQFSLALIKALTDQLKWLGSIYYHIETALLGTVADISLAILSLRYVFLLLVIGGALGYFGLWWFLAVYALVILIGVVRLFQSARLPPDPDVEKNHQEVREKSVKFLRIPLRVLAMLVSLYFSWQFMDWKAMTPSSFETLAEEKQVVSGVKKTSGDIVSGVQLPEESSSSTIGEAQWEKLEEKTKTCEVAWNNKDFKNGWCSLGEFPAGDYRFEVTSSLKIVDLHQNELSIPSDGLSVNLWKGIEGSTIFDVFNGYAVIKNGMLGMIIFKIDNEIPLSTRIISINKKSTVSASINFPPTESNWKAQGFHGAITIDIFKKKS